VESGAHPYTHGLFRFGPIPRPEHPSASTLCFHEVDCHEATEFVTEQLRMPLIGRSEAYRLAEAETPKHSLSSNKSSKLKQVIGYLVRSRRHMRHGMCLAKGYPIGSETMGEPVQTSTKAVWKTQE
jgi:hypothetical protein